MGRQQQRHHRQRLDTAGVISVSGTIKPNKYFVQCAAERKLHGFGWQFDLNAGTTAVSTAANVNAIIDTQIVTGVATKTARQFDADRRQHLRGPYSRRRNAFMTGPLTGVGERSRLPRRDVARNRHDQPYVTVNQPSGVIWPASTLASQLPSTKHLRSTASWTCPAVNATLKALISRGSTRWKSSPATHSLRAHRHVNIGYDNSGNAGTFQIVQSAPITTTFVTVIRKGRLQNYHGSIAECSGDHRHRPQPGMTFTAAQNTNISIQFPPAGGVTPVRVEAFTARPEGAGVLLEWTAVSNGQNLGFNLWRRIAGDEVRLTRINLRHLAAERA